MRNKRLKMPKFEDGKGVFKRYFVDNPDQIRLNGETGDWQVLDENGKPIVNNGGFMLPDLVVRGQNIKKANDEAALQRAFQQSEIWNGRPTGHGALETVSPEFDALMLGRQLYTDIGKRTFELDKNNPPFFSQLDDIQNFLKDKSSSEIREWLDSNPALASRIIMSKASTTPVFGNNKSLQSQLNDVLEFYKNDVYPRIVKADGEAEINSLVKPDLLTSTPGLDNVEVTQLNLNHPRIAGFAHGSKQYVLGNRSDILNTIAHETRHNLGDWMRQRYRYLRTGARDILGYTRRENDALNSAYSFDHHFISSHPDMVQIKEKAATNTELRYALSDLFSKKVGHKVYGKELDNMIYNMETDDLLSQLENINGYGQSFVKRIQEGSTDEWQTWLRKAKAADNIKYALKYVGGYGVPITIGGKSLYNLRQPINSDTK